MKKYILNKLTPTGTLILGVFTLVGIVAVIGMLLYSENGNKFLKSGLEFAKTVF